MIDKVELARRFGLASVKGVEILMRKRALSYYRIGHRTVRFSWKKAQAELASYEVKGIASK